ncbi:MAG: tetratricopeptide repeat protein [Burkholderiales bacterium]
MILSPGFRTTALLGVPVVLAYLNSLSGAFQFDDFNVIVDNPVAHSLEAWWGDLGHGIRPALKLTYAINWTLWPNPPGFHVFNGGVHLVNTVLVFVLARLLIETYGEPTKRHAPAAAVIAALLFALHPAQTEAVTYISGRSTSLMATFYLGSIVCYITATLRERSAQLHGLSALLFCLAIAAKESAIALPFALLVWEASRRAPRTWMQVARRLAIHGAVLVAAAVLLICHPIYGERVIPNIDPDSISRNLRTQIDAVTYLVTRMIAIHPLNIDPDLRVVTAWSTLLVLKAFFIVAIFALGIRLLRRRPWWGFGILWFFVQLAPTNSLLPRLDLANDRQIYLASIGLFVAIGLEVELLRERIAWTASLIRPLVMALLVMFGTLTALRNRDYATEIRLWEQTANVSPNKPRVFNNLGFAYSGAGCLQQAEAAYRQALRLDPEYAVARDNLASLLERARAEPTLRCDRTG